MTLHLSVVLQHQDPELAPRLAAVIETAWPENVRGRGVVECRRRRAVNPISSCPSGSMMMEPSEWRLYFSTVRCVDYVRIKWLKLMSFAS